MTTTVQHNIPAHQIAEGDTVAVRTDQLAATVQGQRMLACVGSAGAAWMQRPGVWPAEVQYANTDAGTLLSCGPRTMLIVHVAQLGETFALVLHADTPFDAVLGGAK